MAKRRWSQTFIVMPPADTAVIFDREQGWHLLTAPPIWWLEERDAGLDRVTVTPLPPTPLARRALAGVAQPRLSKGQRAMLAAVDNPVARLSYDEQSGRVGVSRTLLSQASIVHANAPRLVDAVLSGDVPLKEACAEACADKIGSARRPSCV